MSHNSTSRVQPSSERTRLLDSDSDTVAPSSAREKQDGLSPGSFRFWLLVLAYSALLFLFSANATGITTMYFAIAESLHAYHAASTWIVASFMIASSCTTPLIGRLSTLFRPTSIFLVCAACFTVGQVCAGLAGSVSVFIAGRILTGIGAGGLFTTTNVLLIEGAPVHRRGLLLGIVNCVVTCGSSLGGVIGGAFAASRYGWRPAFMLQAPIAATGAALVYFFSPSPQPKEAHLTVREKFQKIDYLGIIMLSTCLMLLLSAAMASHFTATPLVMGLGAMALFVLVEYRFAQRPIIPVSLLANPATLFACFCSLFGMTARWVLLYYSPIWAMAVLGFHPARAGATLIPTSFGFGLGGLIIGHFNVRHAGTYYWQSLASLVLFISTYVFFYFLRLSAPISSYVVLLIVNGLGAGAVLVYTMAHILSTTSEKAIVTGLYNTFRGLAPTFGAGIAGGILQRRLQKSLVASILAHNQAKHLTADDLALIERLKASPTLVWQLQGWQREIGIQAYEYAIKIIFLVAIFAGILAFICQLFTYTEAVTPAVVKDDGDIEDYILED